MELPSPTLHRSHGNRNMPIGEFTEANSPDRNAIYGALNITKDKAWLRLAQKLK